MLGVKQKRMPLYGMRFGYLLQVYVIDDLFRCVWLVACVVRGA